MKRTGLAFLCVAWCALASAAMAQPANSYETCSHIPDPKARLACYDNARPVPPTAAPLPMAPPSYAAPAPTYPGVPMPPAPRTASRSALDAFGLRHAKTSLQRITAGVEWVKLNDRDRFTVGLDNGQVWRQFNDDTGKARFSRNPQRDRVLIKHGFFDSYDLVLNRSNTVYRVERIQ